jgi:hypothetical protein
MRRSTPLLALLLVAVALAPAVAAPHPQVGDEPSAGGWGARAPAWQDPGGRATVSAGGDAPRALPPAQARARRGRAARYGTPLMPRQAGPRRPSLIAMGRRQDDGG